MGRDTGPASSEQCARHGPQQGESIEFLREQRLAGIVHRPGHSQKNQVNRLADVLGGGQSRVNRPVGNNGEQELIPVERIEANLVVSGNGAGDLRALSFLLHDDFALFKAN
ncbi:TPA: hypothetical protein ACGJT8_003173 [Pseudomonas aeruginosa]|uniref:hypothetical protein n=1 Tax=Pseudomonas aeruginosa TaxID=287 RepID=UPI0012ACD690|nr:hypothetical protein [Pseudomonas aeruginosa]